MGLEVAALAVAASGVGYSVYQGERASDAQQKANNRARRIEEIKAQRERANAIRVNRINAATIQAQAANAGVAGSSAVVGTVASMGTQAAVGANEANRIDMLRTQQQNFMDQANRANQQASYGQLVTGFALSAGSMAGKPAPKAGA